MERNGKPTMKCLKEHEWEEASNVVYAQPDCTITRECTGTEGEYSKLYRGCKRCGEPQVRDWEMVARYNHKSNPLRVDEIGYMKKLKEKFE